MATPTLLRVDNIALPNSATSTSPAFTPPSGANACVIGGTFYVSDNSVATALTGTQLASTTNGGLRTATPSGGNYMSSYAAAFQVSSLASQTVTLTKSGSYAEGPTCQIIWLTVDDPTDFVRTGGFLIDSQNSTPDTLTVTVNSSTTDLVVGMFGTDGSSANPTVPTGTTLQGTMQTTQFDKSVAFSVNSPGASTTTITAGARDFPTLFGISLKAGGGGATTHGSTGALVGPGSAISGSAARIRAHGASGALTGPGSAVVGSARHNVPHASSGDVIGPGSTVAGVANRTRLHTASGDLVGQGSAVDGSAARTRSHAASGALTGAGSDVAGSASRTRVHNAAGSLVGPGAEVVGSADHQAAAGVHDASGVLVGQGSTVSGSAARFRTFVSSGALTGPGSTVTGSAARVPGPVSHASSGALVGQGSSVSGLAQLGEIAQVAEVIPTYVVGKKPKTKERKLMGGPRWERHELEDLRALVQTRPFEEADRSAREAIEKASRREEIAALVTVADAMDLLAKREALEAQALESAILAEQQALEDAQIMAVIAELL